MLNPEPKPYLHYPQTLNPKPHPHYQAHHGVAFGKSSVSGARLRRAFAPGFWGFWALGFGVFRVQGLGFRAQGLGFRV